jgi:hypothetical protein
MKRRSVLCLLGSGLLFWPTSRQVLLAASALHQQGVACYTSASYAQAESHLLSALHLYELIRKLKDDHIAENK